MRIPFPLRRNEHAQSRAIVDEEYARRVDFAGARDGLLGYTPRERAERAKFRGNIRGTRVTNRHVIEGALAYSVIAGLDEAHEVEKVAFEGLEYQGRPIRNAAQGKLTIEHASGVELS